MKAKLIYILFSSLIMALPLTVIAHGGGLDGTGCHTNRKTGEYHCHRNHYTAPAANAPSWPVMQPRTQPSVQPQAQPYFSSPMPTYSNMDGTCYTGPRGGRYKLVNGKKRYGC